MVKGKPVKKNKMGENSIFGDITVYLFSFEAKSGQVNSLQLQKVNVFALYNTQPNYIIYSSTITFTYGMYIFSLRWQFFCSNAF